MRLRSYLGFLSDPAKAKKAFLSRLPGTLHTGKRSVSKLVRVSGQACLKKVFDSTPLGRTALDREVLARQLFKNRPWMSPILKRRGNWLVQPLWPEERRLDLLAPKLDRNERTAIAHQAVWALFEMFMEGCAHCDFHAKNMFWVDGILRITDFEFLQTYPEGNRPAFADSYDIRGTSLESPLKTNYMCYTADHTCALQPCLGIPVEEALTSVRKRIEDALLQASMSFQKHGGRHTPRARRIYGSFSLPHFSIAPSETQRNCARRLERFSVNEAVLKDKSLLDLGCSTGAMMFEAQKLGPSRCLGVEYDANKIVAARQVAAYCGLRNVTFTQADIEKLRPKDIGGPFYVVFCLALEGHLKNKPRLYRLLGELTAGVLFFEGNSSTDADVVGRELHQCGFRKVRYVGVCDDDCLPDNNCRPLFVATK